MKLKLIFPLVLAAAIFSTSAPAQTGFPPTNDAVASGYFRLQEQLHATQLAMEQGQSAAVAAAKSNADVLAARLQSLEQSVAAQRATDSETARKTQQLTLFLAGVFGLAGLGIMLLMGFFQWRAFSQLAEISAHQHAAIANASAVHQLAAPGRATVETSNARLLDVVDQLEKRIHELESGQRSLPEIAVAAKPADNLLAEGQNFLDANAPEKALECLEKIVSAHPDHALAQVKKALALEKLGRNDEALACYNRALAADGALAIAHLHKGGLLNQMRRYDEALQCYEEALRSQEKKA